MLICQVDKGLVKIVFWTITLICLKAKWAKNNSYQTTNKLGKINCKIVQMIFCHLPKRLKIFDKNLQVLR